MSAFCWNISGAEARQRGLKNALFFYIVQISSFYFKKQSSKRKFGIQFGLIINIFELGTYSILPQFGKYPIFIFKNPSTLHIVDCRTIDIGRTWLRLSHYGLWEGTLVVKTAPGAKKGGSKVPLIFL